ncbi:hypothetical protein Pelo_78 [Pelomyxa schiedti]|nr:hypothetical protein Pelo_78 [Pelomyxa schiedti]
MKEAQIQTQEFIVYYLPFCLRNYNEDSVGTQQQAWKPCLQTFCCIVIQCNGHSGLSMVVALQWMPQAGTCVWCCGYHGSIAGLLISSSLATSGGFSTYSVTSPRQVQENTCGFAPLSQVFFLPDHSTLNSPPMTLMVPCRLYARRTDIHLTSTPTTLLPLHTPLYLTSVLCAIAVLLHTPLPSPLCPGLMSISDQAKKNFFSSSMSTTSSVSIEATNSHVLAWCGITRTPEGRK